MILLFSAGGRTGNQLFQISYAISNRRRGEWIVSFGFGQTRSILIDRCKQGWLNLDGVVFLAVGERLVYPILYRLLVRRGLIPSHFDAKGLPVVRAGRIRSLTLMKGYFESARRHVRDLPEFFQIKKSLQARVRLILDSVPAGRPTVFVHIRRTDFAHLAWDADNPKSMLPDSYYVKAVQMVRERHPRTFFIIVGDDPGHAETLFKHLEGKYVSRLPPFDDLALMSLCDGGVLSNSTFAWWGAYFGRGRLGYVVPKYWSGWAVKRWHPPEIRADFMTQELDV